MHHRFCRFEQRILEDLEQEERPTIALRRVVLEIQKSVFGPKTVPKIRRNKKLKKGRPKEAQEKSRKKQKEEVSLKKFVLGKENVAKKSTKGTKKYKELDAFERALKVTAGLELFEGDSMLTFWESFERSGPAC